MGALGTKVADLGMGTAMLRLVIVDDHPVLRDGLRAALGSQPGFEIVGEAEDAESAYATCEAQQPDVVLLDLSLPGLSGVSVARHLKRRSPDTKVVMFTVHSGEDFVLEALGAGASGYVLKQDPVEVLLNGIRAVTRGELFISPRFPRSVLQTHLRRRSGMDLRISPLDELSQREREVFDRVITGFTNEGVGQELGVSVKTVETHRTSINRKLGVHSTADLVRLAARRGLLRD